MKYVWIIMLAVADLAWIVASIADIIHVIKDSGRFRLDPVTRACIGTHVAILFIIIFLLWLFD